MARPRAGTHTHKHTHTTQTPPRAAKTQTRRRSSSQTHQLLLLLRALVEQRIHPLRPVADARGRGDAKLHLHLVALRGHRREP